MRIAIAMMSHETNTFSPVVTDLARFSRQGHSAPPAGEEAIGIYRGTASCLGGYLEVAEDQGADVFMPIAAGAPPSGPVEDDAFEFMADAIVAAAPECDAMLLDLHGAMVTRSYDDGEGELLRRLREARPGLPIAVSLDMHANLTELMVNNATLITGYQTYPHVDMDETARRAARLFFEHLTGRFDPVMVWGNAPMLPHVMRQGTDDEPNKTLQKRLRELEADGDMLVSLFTGFPHADIHDAGLCVVAVANGDMALAEGARDELLDSAWAGREQFVYQPEPLEESLARAQTIAAEDGGGPVIILDHYDNTASGGTMDTTEVLAAVLDEGLKDVAVFGFFDPDSVQQMVEAGVGSEVTVQLGAKLPMPALENNSAPLTLTGRVKLISDGRFPATVAMSRGLTMNMGTTVVLHLPGEVDVIVISRHTEPFDPGCFRSLGIEPTERTYLMLKSRVHYRVGFRDMAKAVVECAGRGVCTSDYSEVTFEKVRRPIYPLDGVNADREDWLPVE
ncbi:MAG: M81 family metallopeptidase [Pseudomonadales bacterium]|nr:microcystin degradation protein MlrC [Acidiferrobacteraceae bacterium]MDP6375442.1 M81 family metallopeptidase [Pseudomonadales bacterium]MDP6470653.1 M81 family metallopeptidase [Pseudomonadales bacterium]MDP6828491.1 M81 family metallopeptidase [Pseudomonadales bacterium]MDP6970524.1 M81 family metallopeptidase [Pseudomonadales bacterium]